MVDDLCEKCGDIFATNPLEFGFDETKFGKKKKKIIRKSVAKSQISGVCIRGWRSQMKDCELQGKANFPPRKTFLLGLPLRLSIYMYKIHEREIKLEDFYSPLSFSLSFSLSPLDFVMRAGLKKIN